MKQIKKLLFILLVALIASACDQRNFDMPPLNVPEFYGGANITIKDFIAKYNSNLVQVVDNDTIGGYVVANDISGNIYKQIQLQDETGGLCIAINQNSIYNDYRVGQQIFIACKDLYMGKYGGYPQLGDIYLNASSVYAIGQMTWAKAQDHFFLIGNPDTTKVKSDTVTIEKLSVTSPYVGRLITVTDVRFEKGGQEVFAEPGANNAPQTLSKNLISSTDPNSKLVCRNSSAANFATTIMPSGIGSVTGVLSVFNGTLQITFRDSLDCAHSRFGDFGTGDKTSPWTIPYALSHQDGTTKGWIQGYIVGAVAAGITTDNPITGNNNGIIFAAPFLPNTVVLAASADEKDWTKCVVVGLPMGSAIQTQVNLMDHAGNLGKLLEVNGTLQNYLGAAGLATIGSANDFVFGGTTPGGGDGTQANPFTVAQGIANQGAAANNNYKWVTGYVVGIWEGSDANGNDIYPNNFAKFEPPFYSNVNLLLADSPEETTLRNCLNVQLPASMRSALSPMNNPNILKQSIKINGSLETYNSMAGVKNLQSYETGGVNPPPNPSGVIFLETCGGDGQVSGQVAPADYAGWDNKTPVAFSGNVVIRKTNSMDTHVWFAAWSAQYPDLKYLTVSGINTAGCTGMTLSFDVTHNLQGSSVKANLMTVSVKDMNTGTETALTVPATDLAYNSFATISGITGIPATSNLQITFKTTETNTMGMRLDNIRIEGVKP